jgi:diguanylate cyclase (GGDEF)-like protein
MRILIADDDPLTRLLLDNALTDAGYEVNTAADGFEAWEALRRDDAPPLAILDWMMPGLDGVDVCRKVRLEGETPYVYIIMLTGRTETRYVVQGMEAGADDYVSKPFDEQELQVRVRAGRRIVDLQEALRTQATRDALTAVWNRRAILEVLQRELSRAARAADPVGVVMADVDRFKAINDAHGHLVGDAVLREAARRMSAAVRPYDALGRYGGEEFLIVLPGCDPAQTLGAAERIRACVSQAPVLTPAGPIPVTVSLGVATAFGPGRSVDGLIRLADEALYRAKAGGRNRVGLAAGPEALAIGPAA